MSAPRGDAPAWVSVALLPLVNVTLAFIVAGLIVALIGESPWEAVQLLIGGALGSAEAIGYTLYYATSLIFTGLAVAVAFHAGLFNIGGEGQAYVGGLGVGLVVLALDDVLPSILLIPAAIAFGCSPLPVQRLCWGAAAIQISAANISFRSAFVIASMRLALPPAMRMRGTVGPPSSCRLRLRACHLRTWLMTNSAPCQVARPMCPHTGETWSGPTGGCRGESRCM